MDAVQVTLVQIDVIKRLTESYPNHLHLVRTADGEQRLGCTHGDFGELRTTQSRLKGRVCALEDYRDGKKGM